MQFSAAPSGLHFTPPSTNSRISPSSVLNGGLTCTLLTPRIYERNTFPSMLEFTSVIFSKRHVIVRHARVRARDFRLSEIFAARRPVNPPRMGTGSKLGWESDRSREPLPNYSATRVKIARTSKTRALTLETNVPFCIACSFSVALPRPVSLCSAYKCLKFCRNSRRSRRK